MKSIDVFLRTHPPENRIAVEFLEQSFNFLLKAIGIPCSFGFPRSAIHVERKCIFEILSKTPPLVIL